jgi:protoheme IX farnesyltransferase
MIMASTVRLAVSLLKLRIGVAIAATAVAGMAAASGPPPAWWQVTGLAVAVLGASGAAGAFNHYYDRDLDRLMHRTQARPFASGAFSTGPRWLAGILALLLTSLALAWATGGTFATVFVFCGAVTYGVVYTVWLKRRTVWNIVIGGLAGSFALLAGAAAVDPAPQTVPIVLAIVLFLWTPPHFWSLAAAKDRDYANAAVPMLPIVVPPRAWTLAILGHIVALVTLSLVPLWFSMGWIYGLGALSGGLVFVWKGLALYREPTRAVAMQTFLASLVQLSLLILGTVLDRAGALWS